MGAFREGKPGEAAMDDPLSATEAPPERVVLDDLPSWASIPDEEADSTDPGTLDFTPIFGVREDLNQKVYLWYGDILSLEVDAVVNSTNETLTDRTGLCGRIFDMAGPDLVPEVNALEGCRTGESKITKGYQLPFASHIIHTVGPRYNLRYKTAAENALHNCYRSMLQILVENKLRSIGICVVNSPKRCYPKGEAAHITFRTVRRCLENNEMGDKLEAVVFVVDNDEDLELYQKTLKLYFPRNQNDLVDNRDKYPADIDDIDEVGAKVITERQIRISAFPAALPGESPEREVKKEAIVPRAPIDTESGLKDFMTPNTGTPDERLRTQQSRKSPKQLEKESIDRMYQKLLQAAKSEDLGDIARRNCLYQSGNDSLGRPIIVCVGSRFPAKKNRPLVQQLTKFIIRTLDPISDTEFVIIYLHAGIVQPQEPEFAWLKMMYRLIDLKCPKLANFYIVHPSLWIRFTMKFLTPFMNDSFTAKLRYIQSLNELFNLYDQSVLRIPDKVYKYDQEQNGSRYASESDPRNEGL